MSANVLMDMQEWLLEEEATENKELEQEEKELDTEEKSHDELYLALSSEQKHLSAKMTYIARHGADETYAILYGLEEYGDQNSIISQELFKELGTKLAKAKKSSSFLAKRILNWIKMAWVWIKKMVLKGCVMIKKIFTNKKGKLDKLLAKTSDQLADLKVIDENLKKQRGKLNAAVHRFMAKAGRSVVNTAKAAVGAESFNSEIIEDHNSALTYANSIRASIEEMDKAANSFNRFYTSKIKNLPSGYGSSQDESSLMIVKTVTTGVKNTVSFFGKVCNSIFKSAATA